MYLTVLLAHAITIVFFGQADKKDSFSDGSEAPFNSETVCVINNARKELAELLLSSKKHFGEIFQVEGASLVNRIFFIFYQNNPTRTLGNIK